MRLVKGTGYLFLYQERHFIFPSVLGGDVYDFPDTFDTAYTTQMELENILNRIISL